MYKRSGFGRKKHYQLLLQMVTGFFFFFFKAMLIRKGAVCVNQYQKNKGVCLYKTSKGVNYHDLKMFNNCGSSGGVSWENLLQLKSLALLKDSVLQSNLLELLSKFLVFQKVIIFQSNFLAFQEIGNSRCVYIRTLRTHSQYRTAAG